MTCTDIQNALFGNGVCCLWHPLRQVGVRNSTGVAGWEADLLVIQPTGMVYEIEIKVSVGDFRREFTHKSQKYAALLKGKHPGPRGEATIVHHFMYAMPKEIYEKVKSEIPDWAGLILLDGQKAGRRFVPRIVRRGKRLPGRKATDSDRAAAMRSIYCRYWDKIATLEGSGE